jgi:outer membrane protein OmpA-like peptidoglycan-associated protein
VAGAGAAPDRTVNGYCDIIGGIAYNQRLSERRVNTGRATLRAREIVPNRLVAHGYGKTQFVVTNATAEDRARTGAWNRCPKEVTTC